MNCNTFVVEPISKKGFNILNPNAILEKLAPGYCRTEFKPNGGGDSTTIKAYTCPDDPRLYASTRGWTVPIDSPPITVPSYEYVEQTQNTSNYGQHYNGDYKNVTGGQITYYVDKSIEDAYFNPVFFNKAVVEKILYTDPMDKRSVMYIRTPVVAPCNSACLKPVTDFNAFREDIMSTQMRARNRERYELNR